MTFAAHCTYRRTVHDVSHAHVDMRHDTRKSQTSVKSKAPVKRLEEEQWSKEVVCRRKSSSQACPRAEHSVHAFLISIPFKVQQPRQTSSVFVPFQVNPLFLLFIAPLFHIFSLVKVACENVFIKPLSQSLCNTSYVPSSVLKRVKFARLSQKFMPKLRVGLMSANLGKILL